MRIKAKLEVPKGYFMVTRGNVRADDLTLDIHACKGVGVWSDADDGEGMPVSAYYGVIRKLPGRDQPRGKVCGGPSDEV